MSIQIKITLKNFLIEQRINKNKQNFVKEHKTELVGEKRELEREIIKSDKESREREREKGVGSKNIRNEKSK